MKKYEPSVTRRKLFKWGVGTLALFTSSKLLWWKNNPKKTVKMLTREGKLVEVDITQLQPKRRFANKLEVQTWVWPQQGANTNPANSNGKQ